MPCLLDAEVRVTLGIDTHSDVHVAVALDQLGRRLGACTVAATPAGSRELLGWASRFGPIEQVGSEGTSSWGLGLARFLRAQGLVVLDVNRPNRQTRRRRGKSDPVDAEAAARAVQAGTATTVAKSADGQVEMIRTLRLVRRSAPLGLPARPPPQEQLKRLERVPPPGRSAGQGRGRSTPPRGARPTPGSRGLHALERCASSLKAQVRS
jgi:transposase